MRRHAIVDPRPMLTAPESRLFQPRMAIKIGCYAGAELTQQRMRRAEAAEHFTGDLRIARFVCPDEPEAVAAQVRSKSVGKKENGKSKELNGLT